MDLMRLPLGILTGVGFIGAGAIVRKGEMIVGVTTASTIWFSTVVGLCLGGGQIVLGSVSTVLGLGVLWGLRRVENHVENYQAATLKVTVAGEWPSADELRSRLLAAHFHINTISIRHSLSEQRRTVECELRWPSANGGDEVPRVITELEHLPGVVELGWHPSGPGQH
jgi:putative Mg2+ transporter-C (MgtC) family protein